MKSIPFVLDVPRGISFYSAHFKIDAMRWFATRAEDEYSVLLDNDVVALAPLPDAFVQAVEAGRPLRYTLEKEINDANRQTVHGFCQEVDAKHFAWAGGEVIGGTASFYKQLVEKIDGVLPRYFAALQSQKLFHTGDEMPVSIAWHLLEREGVQPVDAYEVGLLYRYWGNVETKSLRHYGTSLMHLPYDKVFLAKVNVSALQKPADIVRLYRRQRLRNTIVRWGKRLLGRA